VSAINEVSLSFVINKEWFNKLGEPLKASLEESLNIESTIEIGV
jgi:hypothetical protein